MTIKDINFKSHIQESIYKAVIGTAFFMIVYLMSSIEIIRSNVEDTAFDVMNRFVIQTIKQDTESPNVLLFKVDDFYLRENKMLDDKNNTNYGYLFPRDKIAKFILRLDDFIKEVKLEQNPQALFVDYDFSYTSLPYNNKLSKEDLYLLEVLKKDRDYKIYLPKTNDLNFIEHSSDEKIQKLIESKKLVFVSVSLIESSDGTARRYLPSKEFYDGDKKRTYTHAMVSLWQNSKTTKKRYDFKNKNDIENRIIFKGYEEKIDEDTYEMYLSNWQKLFVYSANYPLDEIIEENFYDSIILLSGAYSNSNDTFSIGAVQEQDSLSGIEVQANALMSLFYLDGSMKKFDFFKSSALVFMLFLCLNLILEVIFDILGFTDRRNLEMITLLVIISAIMFYISYHILMVYRQWFDWFVPIVLFEGAELIVVIQKYVTNLYGKRNKDEKNEKSFSIPRLGHKLNSLGIGYKKR